jgi:S-adenosylmethionine:tRNA ribosyltransferase-isomerase
MLTGMHPPGESHFELLRAFADDPLLDRLNATAIDRGYRAHEFGDSLLIERQSSVADVAPRGIANSGENSIN